MSELTINKKLEGTTLTVYPEGRIDTNTAKSFGDEITASLSEASTLILEFEKVSYISSSALRVLLNLNKAMDAKGGELILKNPTDLVYDVFEVTGFNEALRIER